MRLADKKAVSLGNLMTSKEVAAKLDVSPSTVRVWAWRKLVVPALRIGSNMLFDRKKIAEFAKIARPEGRPRKIKNTVDKLK